MRDEGRDMQTANLRPGGTRGPGTRGGSRKGYPIRERTSGGYYTAIPTYIGRHVPEGETFKAELVEEGILLRRVDPTPDLPAWVQS